MQEKGRGKREKSKKERDSEVNVEDIRRVVSNWTGIPLNTLGSKEKTALLRLDSRINRLVIGQKEAVNSVVSAIKRARMMALIPFINAFDPNFKDA